MRASEQKGLRAWRGARVRMAWAGCQVPVPGVWCWRRCPQLSGVDVSVAHMSGAGAVAL